jgi:hypothetical protein
MGMLSARLAVGHMPGNSPSLPNPERPDRLLATSIDHGVYLLAPAATRDFLILDPESAASAEERALHHRPGHSHPLPDLGVGETFQLAENDDLVMALAQPPECSAEVIELLTAL